MPLETKMTPQNLEIKEQIRLKLQQAVEQERNDDPYDEIFAEIEHLMSFVNPSQKDGLEYSTQNSEDEKVNFLGRVATIYEWIGDFKEAMKFYEELDDIVSGHAKILKGLADCLRNQGRHEEAIAKYEEALDNYFHDEELDASILHGKALSHIELSYSKLDSESKTKELGLAQEDLKKAVEFAPDNVLYLCSLGKVLDIQEVNEEAFDMYKKAEELIVAGKTGEGFEPVEASYFEEVLPQLMGFKSIVKACEEILSAKMKIFEEPSFKTLREWMRQKTQEANAVLSLENFRCEYRERIFRHARVEKEINTVLFKKQFDRIVGEQKEAIKQKEKELIEKLKGLKSVEEDMKIIEEIQKKHKNSK